MTMYIMGNPQTKKALREMVADPKNTVVVFPAGLGRPVENGEEVVSGPHAPAPHKWYAIVLVEGGRVTKVLK